MATPTRSEVDAYWLDRAARFAADSARCVRRSVGAVIVQPSPVPPYVPTSPIGWGANSAPIMSGLDCRAGDCPRANSSVPSGSSYDEGAGRCIAVHAEMRAAVNAGGSASVGATLYVTDEPCYMCRLVIAATGVVRVVWPEGEYKL